MDLHQNKALPDDVEALKTAVGSLAGQVACLSAQLAAAHAELNRLRAPAPTSARLTRTDGVFPSSNPFAATRHAYPSNPFGAYPSNPFGGRPTGADPFGSSTESPSPFGRM